MIYEYAQTSCNCDDVLFILGPIPSNILLSSLLAAERALLFFLPRESDEELAGRQLVAAVSALTAVRQKLAY